MRFNMPFGRVGAGEFGTYFIGYARTPDVIEQMLTNMFIGKPAGQLRPDPRLLDRGDRQPVLRARPSTSSTTRPSRRRHRRRRGCRACRSASDDSLAIGSLKGTSESDRDQPIANASRARR